jgi:hypothetical protein
MENMKDVGLEIGGKPAGTPDPSDEGQVLEDSQVIHCPKENIQDSPIPAAGAKDQRKSPFPNILVSQGMHIKKSMINDHCPLILVFPWECALLLPI